MHTYNSNSMVNNYITRSHHELLECFQPQPRCFPFSFDVSIVYSGSNPMVLSAGEPGYMIYVTQSCLIIDVFVLRFIFGNMFFKMLVLLFLQTVLSQSQHHDIYRGLESDQKLRAVKLL